MIFFAFETESPAYTKPQSATDALGSPRPGPAKFIFDVPLPQPAAKHETRFRFDAAAVKRRSSEPRAKNKAKEERRRVDTETNGPVGRRRSSTHQHSVPPARRTSVHVTANPLDAAGGSGAAGRTTIVVQQPSLSLDYGGCATVLLRDDAADNREHFRQLLDVTFTSEDLYEFDKR